MIVEIGKFESRLLRKQKQNVTAKNKRALTTCSASWPLQDHRQIYR